VRAKERGIRMKKETSDIRSVHVSLKNKNKGWGSTCDLLERFFTRACFC